MGQIANCEYVCGLINATYGTSLVPASGTAKQVASMEYLLKVIDKVNGGATSYGTGAYATKQAADITAVNDAVGRLIKKTSAVAVCMYSSTAAFSSDGKTWGKATLPYSSSWYRVAFGGTDNLFIAVCQSAPYVAYSADGLSWSGYAFESSSDINGFSALAASEDIVVALFSNDTVALVSPNGVSNWSFKMMPGIYDWTDICHNIVFVAVAGGTDVAAYSTDGKKWEETKMPSSAYWTSVTYCNGKFVAVSSEGKSAYSVNGKTWTAGNDTGQVNLISIGNNYSRFVAVGTASTQQVYSTDGISWTSQTFVSGKRFGAVSHFFDGGIIVTPNYSSTTGAFSANGSTWTSTTFPESGGWLGLANKVA